MKALVTGDLGFVGSNYVKFLKNEGWDVYGMDIREHYLLDAIPFFVEDDSEHYDLIVHCAYEVGGRAHIDGSNMALAQNVMLDASMFRWALKGGTDAVMYFSSSAAYPKHLQSKFCWKCDVTPQGGNPIPLQEDEVFLDDPESPDANYGWAKLTGEKIAAQASAQGLRVHVLRPFSGYGSDQSLSYPFPSIIKRAMEGDLTVWGPPGQTRDWIHIDDLIKGSFQVYLNDERRPVNLCTGIGTEMGELMLLAYTGTRSGYKITYLEDKPTGVFYRVGDPTRFNEHYQPKISIEEGVSMALGRSTKT